MIGARGAGSLVVLDASRWDGDKRSLAELPVVQRARCPNQMFHRVVASTFYRVFGAPAGGSDPPDGAIWSLVWLATTGYLAQYSVTEFEASYQVLTSPALPGMAMSGGSDHAWNGQFIADQEMEPHGIWSEPFTDGKLGMRAVHRTVRFLWTKAMAVSTEIRSIYFAMAVQGNGWSTAWDGYGNSVIQPFARVRLLDSGGQPMTMSKTADEVAVLEYTMSLVSM